MEEKEDGDEGALHGLYNDLLDTESRWAVQEGRTVIASEWSLLPHLLFASLLSKNM